MIASPLKNLKTPIAIIGMGKSGEAAHALLLAAGFNSSELITFDEKNSKAQLSQWSDLENAQALTWVVSPGVPLQHPSLLKAREKGVFITSELGLAAHFLKEELVIGVTGSVGKSTVTTLLGVAAQSAYKNIFVGGNLGTPLSEYALKKLTLGQSGSCVVLEISSYQLENCFPLQLDYSILTFLSANHLERYESLQHYYNTKLHITEITKKVCVMNKTSEDVVKMSAQAKCSILLTNAEKFSEHQKIPQLMMLGSHNRDNYALAAELAKICVWPESSFKAMAEYRGLPHRLEFVGHIKNVSYINDSKATALDSVLVAVQACLEGVGPQNKLLLLLGGQDKNLPWENLSCLKAWSQVVPVFFGRCGELAREKSKLVGEYYEKLGHAIQYCQKRAEAGDIVLLSPGGSSLDEFKNFEERGHFFKTIILSE